MASSSRKYIRNITTLGHVDHGKTTLMDSLLASNGIISARMAGKMRYMDSREDEQERGITMEASAVGLKFRVAAKSIPSSKSNSNGTTNSDSKSPPSPKVQSETDTYILNLIDTPGHVDFTSQVSTSSHLTDGALILIDVVEGVSSQTTSLLKQGWEDELEMVLVLNKIDRMILELKLTPDEAYERLKRVVEDVNAVMGGLWGGRRMREADEAADVDVHPGTGTNGTTDKDGEDEGGDDYFDPTKGNVIFASALDGWGFRPSHFARIFAKKLFPNLYSSNAVNASLDADAKRAKEAEFKAKEESLKKVIWGEWYFDSKTKRVVSSKGIVSKDGKKSKPLFVQIVLDNLWMVYDSVIVNPNPSKVLKIISTLSLNLPPRELRAISNLTTSPSVTSTTPNTPGTANNQNSNHQILTSILTSWLPLSTALVQAVIDVIPEPGVAQGGGLNGQGGKGKMGRILGLGDVSSKLEPYSSSSSTKATNGLEHLFSADPSRNVPVAAFVSKMFAVRRGELPRASPSTLGPALAGHRPVQTRASGLGSVASQPTTEDKDESATSTSARHTPIPTSTSEDSGKSRGEGDADEEILLGFARIYSGTLVVGDRIWVVLPRFDPSLQHQHEGVHPSNIPYVLGLGPLSNSTSNSNPDRKDEKNKGKPLLISALYQMMGRELVPVERVQAGEIFAVRFGVGGTSTEVGADAEEDADVAEDVGNEEGEGVGKVEDDETKHKAQRIDKTEEADEELLSSWRTGTIVRPGSASLPSSSGTIEGNGEEEVEMSTWLINLGRINRIIPPIVRLSLLPVHSGDLPALLKGLKILERADPCVEVFQMPGGEWVIGGAGEMHLERCLKDLRERYAKIEFHASKPIVPFRETAVRYEGASEGSTQAGLVGEGPPATQRQFQMSQFGFSGGTGPMGTISTFNDSTTSASTSKPIIQFALRCLPFPPPIRDFLAKARRRGVLGRLRLSSSRERIGQQPSASKGDEGARVKESAEERTFWQDFQDVCRKQKGEDTSLWALLAQKNRFWAFGPQGRQNQIRTQTIGDEERDGETNAGDTGESRGNADADAYGAGCILIDARSKSSDAKSTTTTSEEDADIYYDFTPHIEAGFQLAARQGPICAEPVEGLVFFVEKIEVDWKRVRVEIEQNRLTQTTGSLISSFRDACKSAMLEWSPRLMLAMYSCDIQCSTDVLGKVYAVVSKRKGRIIAEEMKEGTSFFTITARLPVVESFGFSDDIRKRTSGAASPMLVFSGYDLLPLSPFWVPTTTEELEDLGTTSDKVNIAKAYMDGVRERKGMFVDRKIVEHAEKQRTLKK